MGKKDFFIMLAALFALGTYGAGAAKELKESDFVDFAHYYQNSALLKQGYDIWAGGRQFDKASVDLAHRAGFVATGNVVHSPGFFLCMLPFTALPFRAAVYCAFLIGHVLLFFALWLLLKTFKKKFSSEDFWPIIFLVFAFWPLREQLHHNQPNLFILFFLSVSLFLFKKKKFLWSGIMFGIALQFREYLAVMALFFIWKRNWKVLAGIAAGILLLKLSAMAVFGWDKELFYWRYMLYHFAVSHDYSSVSQNLSFTAAVFHVFRGIVPRAGALAIIGSFAAVCIARALTAVKKTDSDPALGFGLFLTLAFLITPWVHESHFVTLCIALIIAWFSLREKPKQYTLFAAAYLLLALRYSLFRFSFFYYSFPAVLYYLKFAGIILLFILLDQQTRRSHAAA
jgi:hypothetical protein